MFDTIQSCGKFNNKLSRSATGAYRWWNKVKNLMKVKVVSKFDDYNVLVKENGEIIRNFKDGLRDKVWKTLKGAESWAKKNGYEVINN